MNIWSVLLGQLVRWLLLLIIAPFVTRGIVSQQVLDQVLNEGTQHIVAIIIAALLFGWSAWRKIIAHLKIKIAGTFPADTPDAVLSAEVNAIPTTTKIAEAFHSTTPKRR